MKNEKLTFGSYMTGLKLFHFAFIGSLVILAILSLIFQFSKSESSSNNETISMLKYIVPIVAIAGIFGSRLIYNYKLQECRKQTSLYNKLYQYQSAVILKFALLEVGAIVGIIAHFLTNNFIYLIIAGIVILFFILHPPTENKLIDDLLLNEEEKKIIADPTTEIK